MRNVGQQVAPRLLHSGKFFMDPGEFFILLFKHHVLHADPIQQGIYFGNISQGDDPSQHLFTVAFNFAHIYQDSSLGRVPQRDLGLHGLKIAGLISLHESMLKFLVIHPVQQLVQIEVLPRLEIKKTIGAAVFTNDCPLVVQKHDPHCHIVYYFPLGHRKDPDQIIIGNSHNKTNHGQNRAHRG